MNNCKKFIEKIKCIPMGKHFNKSKRKFHEKLIIIANKFSKRKGSRKWKLMKFFCSKKQWENGIIFNLFITTFNPFKFQQKSELKKNLLNL